MSEATLHVADDETDHGLLILHQAVYRATAAMEDNMDKEIVCDNASTSSKTDVGMLNTQLEDDIEKCILGDDDRSCTKMNDLLGTQILVQEQSYNWHQLVTPCSTRKNNGSQEDMEGCLPFAMKPKASETSSDMESVENPKRHRRLHFSEGSANEDDRKPSACSGTYRDNSQTILSDSDNDEEKSSVTEDSDEDKPYRPSRTHYGRKNIHFSDSSSNSDRDNEDDVAANKKLLEGIDNDHSQEMDDHSSNNNWLEERSMGPHDNELEGHRDILRRAISVGIFDEGTKNPFIFKIRVGKGTAITPLVDQGLNSWEAGLGFRILSILLYSKKDDKLSLFDEASQIIWCLAMENHVDEWQILSMKGFTLNLPKKRKKATNGYFVKYVKVFDTTKHKKKHEVQKKMPLLAKLEKTLVRLTEYAQDMYEKADSKRLKVKKAEISWTNHKKIANRMENLIQVFHVGLVVTDYVFGFTKDENKVDELIPFCATMLRQVKSFSVFWECMEKFLRVFDGEEAKIEHAELIESIYKYPNHFRNYIMNQEAMDPELYRDALVKRLDNAFRRRHNVYWKGCIVEKDMLIVRYYILNHEFQGSDSKGLLFSKRRRKSDMKPQKTRHMRISALYKVPYEQETSDDNARDDDEESDDTDSEEESTLSNNGINLWNNKEGEDKEQDPNANGRKHRDVDDDESSFGDISSVASRAVSSNIGCDDNEDTQTKADRHNEGANSSQTNESNANDSPRQALLMNGNDKTDRLESHASSTQGAPRNDNSEDEGTKGSNMKQFNTEDSPANKNSDNEETNSDITNRLNADDGESKANEIDGNDMTKGSVPCASTTNNAFCNQNSNDDRTNNSNTNQSDADDSTREAIEANNKEKNKSSNTRTSNTEGIQINENSGDEGTTDINSEKLNASDGANDDKDNNNDKEPTLSGQTIETIHRDLEPNSLNREGIPINENSYGEGRNNSSNTNKLNGEDDIPINENSDGEGRNNNSNTNKLNGEDDTNDGTGNDRGKEPLPLNAGDGTSNVVDESKGRTSVENHSKERDDEANDNNNNNEPTLSTAGDANGNDKNKEPPTHNDDDGGTTNTKDADKINSSLKRKKSPTLNLEGISNNTMDEDDGSSSNDNNNKSPTLNAKDGTTSGIDDDEQMNCNNKNDTIPTGEIPENELDNDTRNKKAVNQDDENDNDNEKRKVRRRARKNSKSCHFKFEGLFTEQDVTQQGLLLSIFLKEMNVRQFIMMSIVQLTWTTALQESQHRVTTMIQESVFMDFNPSIGHVWLPPKTNYVDKKIGVLRKDHSIFKKHFETCLNKLNFGLICKFLQEKGKQDHARDDDRIPSYRIDVGYANHNYEKKQSKRASSELFRPQPMLFGIEEIRKYSEKLCRNISMLLDAMQYALDDTFKEDLHLDPPMNNEYIRFHFIRPMQKGLGCKAFAFTNFTMSLVIIEDRYHDHEEHRNKKARGAGSVPIGTSHEDSLNGQEEGNNLSLIFHALIKLTEGTETFLGRLSVIAYTRRSLEAHEANEKLLIELKERLRNFQRHVNGKYKDLRHENFFGDDSLSFKNPQNMFLDDNIKWENLSIGDITGNCSVRALTLPVTYALELSMSPAITVLRQCLLRLRLVYDDNNAAEKKVIELLLLAAYQGFWGRFFHAGMEMLESTTIDWKGNLATTLAVLMTEKYGSWNGGISLRGRPSSLCFVEHYSNEDNLIKATTAMENFLRRLNDSKDLTMEQYRKRILVMNNDLKGIGEFYAQRIPVLAACAGIILKKNLFRATFAYPIQDAGSHRAIEKFNSLQKTPSEEDIDDTIVAATLNSVKLDATPSGFYKTAKLACWYCDLNDARMSWAENMFCEGVGESYGRVHPINDYVYPKQSLFWLFKLDNGNYEVKEKKYNSKEWVPLT